MAGAETTAAVVFYGALGLLVYGAMRKAGAAIERRRSSRLDDVLLGCACAGLALAVTLFATGPRRLLPF